MKKAISILLSLCLISIISFSQELRKKRILVENKSHIVHSKLSKKVNHPSTVEQKKGTTTVLFDFSAGIPSDFTIIDNDGNTPASDISYINAAWIAANDNGNIIAVSTSWYDPPGQSDDWMITSAITIPEFGKLSWDSHTPDASFPDGYEVRLSTSGVDTADFSTVLFSTPAENATWTKRVVDLSNWVGQTVYIAFRNNSYDKFTLAVDNIHVYYPDMYNATIDTNKSFEYIINPKSNPFYFSKKAINTGYDTITNIKLSVDINSGSYTDSDSVASLLPGDTTTISIAQAYHPTDTGTMNVNFTLSANETEDESDNSLTEQIIISDSVLAREDGTWDEYLGLNTPGLMGNVYSINEDDTITSVSFKLIASNFGDSASVEIYKFGITDTQLVAYTPAVYLDSIETWYTLPVNAGGIILEAGEKYLICVNQLTANNMTLASSYSFFKPNVTYYKVSEEWISVDNIIPICFFIRANFGKAELKYHDIGATEFSYPLSGCDLSSSEDVIVQIQNYAHDTISNFPVSLELNGSIIITDTIKSALPPFSTLSHTFSAPIDFSINDSTYTLRVICGLSGDNNLTNDTNDSYLVEHYLPFGMETITFEYTPGFMDKFVLETNTESAINFSSEAAASGNYGLEMTGNTSSSFNTPSIGEEWIQNEKHSAIISFCVDATSVSYLKMSFLLKQTFSYNPRYSNLRILANGIPVSSTFQPLSENSDSFELQVLDLSDFAGSIFLLSFETRNKYSKDNDGSDIGAGDNAFIDDVIFYLPPAADASIIASSSPSTSCGLGTSDPVIVQILNDGSAPISGFPISYTLNGSLICTDTIIATINPTDTLEHTFSISPDLSNLGSYIIKSFTSLANDGDSRLDTLTFTTVHITSASTPYVMSFDSTENFEFWNSYNVNEDDYLWLHNKDVGNTPGAFYYTFVSNGIDTANDWLFTQCIDLEPNKTYRLMFYTQAYISWGTIYGGNLKVMIGNTQDPSGMTTLLEDLGMVENTDYKRSMIQFTVPSSGRYYIGWNISGPNSIYNFILDDIDVSEMFGDDIKVISLEVPKQKYSCTLSSSENITVKLTNWGLNSVSSFPISYQVDNNTAITETFTRPIAVGDTMEFTFSSKANLSANGVYNIKTYSSLSTDGNLSDDTITTKLSHLFSATIPYTMSFKETDSIAYKGWLSEDSNNDDRSWIYSATNGNTPGCFYYLYNTDAVTSADDWLFSQCIDFVADNTYTIRFYYSVADAGFPEKLRLKVGTLPTSSSMTTELIDLGQISNTDMAQAVCTFTPTISDTYYLGWQAYSDADKYVLFLDDIEINNTTSIDESTTMEDNISIYPNPANDYINIISTNPLTQIKLYNSTGKLIYHKQENCNNDIITTNELCTGIYYILIESKGKQYRKRISVIK